MVRWWGIAGIYSDKELKKVGKEVIRARMDLEKVRINVIYGFIFAFTISILIRANLSSTYNVLGFTLIMTILASVIYLLFICPSMRTLEELAYELDRREEESH